jgi:hypothetical protein
MTTLSPTALSGLERRIAMSRSGRWLLHACGGDVDLVDLLGAMPLRTLPAINDPARPMVDRFLIEQIIAGDRSALRDPIAREVSSDAPLVRHGVVEVDPAPVSLFARLSVSGARLDHAARRIDRMAHWEEVALPEELLDSLREFIGRARHRRTIYAGSSTSVANTRRSSSAHGTRPVRVEPLGVAAAGGGTAVSLDVTARRGTQRVF